VLTRESEANWRREKVRWQKVAAGKGSLIAQGVVAPRSLPGSWFFPGRWRSRRVARGRIDVSDGVMAPPFPRSRPSIGPQQPSIAPAIPARAPCGRAPGAERTDSHHRTSRLAIALRLTSS
jgi:hypothetical protein